nr:DUF488 family protein [Saccharothrix sp.]
MRRLPRRRSGQTGPPLRPPRTGSRGLAARSSALLRNCRAHSRASGAALLCSEDKPHHCHRRLVAEHLARRWDDVTVEHLV